MKIREEACHEDAMGVELFDVSDCAWMPYYVCAVKGEAQVDQIENSATGAREKDGGITKSMYY